MIEKFTISRDDSIYHAWPDVALTPDGSLVCVFSECTHHGDRSYTRIMVCDSSDRGRTWTPKRPVIVSNAARLQSDAAQVRRRNLENQPVLGHRASRHLQALAF